jgi:hypothetical protein
MPSISHDRFFVDPAFQPIIREIGLDAMSVFTDARVKPWRRLEDRENCTLDERLTDGRMIRLHIKRYPKPEPAEREVAGYELLARNDIPAAAIVAHGRLVDGRSFVILSDLSGYTPADKLLDAGTPFHLFFYSTAALTARLHESGLHHRDLYLCHFMVRIDASVDVRLIDAARVARLTNLLTRRRWIVKDLAQFWYSTTKHPTISDEDRSEWLAAYVGERDLLNSNLRRAIERKSAAIARHDAKLNRQQPGRNVSIPRASDAGEA